MRKTFYFGKIDWYGSGRKNCPAEVELRLSESDRGPCFAASASVWNPGRTDIVCGGQCLDELTPFIREPEYQEIVRLWRAYHLNDMHAGTPEQEAEIKRWLNGRRYDYTAARDHLRDVGLLTVTYNGKSYTYGTGWLYEPIPADDLAKIRALITGEEAGL